MYRDHITLPIPTIYTVPQKQPTGCIQPRSKWQWEMRCSGAIKLPQLPKALHVIIRGGRCEMVWLQGKWWGTHSSTSRCFYTTYPSLCGTQVSLQFLCHREYILLDPEKAWGACDCLLWVHGCFTDQSKQLSTEEIQATSVSFLLDAYRSLHTQYWPSDSWFLFLSICFPKRLNPCHTCGLCWLWSSWACFLYQHFLSLPWHILEQQQVV